jgi:ribosomal protein S18 acetylase RimI-like enzyme
MPLPLCVRLPVDDSRSAEALLADRWRQVETLETWRSTAATRGMRHHGISRATAADHRQLVIAAGRWFAQDRLHVDPKVANDAADEAKRQWMKEALADKGRQVWLCGTMPIEGFIIIRPRQPIVIDLIAVDPLFRGKGVAKRLIQHVISTFGTAALQAGTQATNTAAQKLYHSMGMTRVSTQTTWHK